MFTTLAFACKTRRGAVNPCRAGRRQRIISPGAFQASPRTSAPPGALRHAARKSGYRRRFSFNLHGTEKSLHIDDS
jgi:hypothetical protein